MPKQAGVDMISNLSLAMCAFHSARIISRLGQPPLGNMPSKEVVETLRACADSLEDQAGIRILADLDWPRGMDPGPWFGYSSWGMMQLRLLG